MTEHTDTEDSEPAIPLQITPSRTYVNSSATGTYSTPTWPPLRPGADDHKQVASRGF